MISQRCPKCNSSRIRGGYRPTAFWSKLLFRYNLLCDNCNWEFRGFAVPGTVSTKSKRAKKKQDSPLRIKKPARKPAIKIKTQFPTANKLE
jgi:ribosomal protein L37AE/L43A